MIVGMKILDRSMYAHHRHLQGIVDSGKLGFPAEMKCVSVDKCVWEELHRFSFVVMVRFHKALGTRQLTPDYYDVVSGGIFNGIDTTNNCLRCPNLGNVDDNKPHELLSRDGARQRFFGVTDSFDGRNLTKQGPEAERQYNVDGQQENPMHGR